MEFPTWAEVDLDRFARNIAAIRTAVGSGCGILLVVKADAYGHGAVEISRAAMEAGVSKLGVATLHEGIELRFAEPERRPVGVEPVVDLPAEVKALLGRGDRELQVARRERRRGAVREAPDDPA